MSRTLDDFINELPDDARKEVEQRAAELKLPSETSEDKTESKEINNQTWRER